MSIEEAREQAYKAKFLYSNGKIQKTEAKDMVKPFEDAFNEKSKQMAKKFGVRAKKFSFAAFMR